MPVNDYSMSTLVDDYCNYQLITINLTNCFSPIFNFTVSNSNTL